MSGSNKRNLKLMAATGVMALFVSGCGGGGSANPENLPGYDIEGIDDELVQSAAEEGSVFLRTGGHSPGALEMLEEDMQELFGVELTVAREASGDVYSAVEAERASGNVQTDVVGLADATAFEQLEQDGALIDADVPNRESILEGVGSAENLYIPTGLTAIGVMYNTANTDVTDLPSTWEEFAEADLRTLTANPSASGTALGFYSSMIDSNPSFIEDLGARSPAVTDSSLSLAQMVLTGEVDMAIPAVESEVMSLAAEGEPIATKFMEGPVPTTVSSIGVMGEAPNPNAAKLLVHYQLSDEFQTKSAEFGRTVMEHIELGPSLEDLGDRYEPVVPEVIEQNGDAARERFNDSLA